MCENLITKSRSFLLLHLLHVNGSQHATETVGPAKLLATWEGELAILLYVRGSPRVVPMFGKGQPAVVCKLGFKPCTAMLPVTCHRLYMSVANVSCCMFQLQVIQVQRAPCAQPARKGYKTANPHNWSGLKQHRSKKEASQLKKTEMGAYHSFRGAYKGMHVVFVSVRVSVCVRGCVSVSVYVPVSFCFCVCVCLCVFVFVCLC